MNESKHEHSPPEQSSTQTASPPRYSPESSPGGSQFASPLYTRPSSPLGSSFRVSSPSRPPSSPLLSSPYDGTRSPFDQQLGADAPGSAAGFRPDSVGDSDLLDVGREALALAMVLAHKDVDPPISVGLFGDWGSGKSFFMAQMRTLINKLSEQSRDNAGRFCEHIVQLEFNAWHYMDTDIWASLAREIFEGLTTALAEQENLDLDLERERLRSGTQSTKDLISTTDLRVKGVEKQLAVTKRQLTDVEEAQAFSLDEERATVTAVLQTPDVERKLREVASDLGLDESNRSVDELHDRLSNLSGLARFGRAISAAFAREWKALLAGLLIVVLTGAILFVITDWFWGHIATTVARITVLLGAISAVLATVVPGTRAVLKHINEFRRSFDRNLQSQKVDLAREFQARREALAAEHRRLEEQRAHYQQELDQLKKLSAELERLDASHQLVDFIRQRDASEDYRSQLGTIARASQDFKRLSDLMQRATAARQRKAENRPLEGDEEDARLPRVDRIVLYIDDLDRCPEAKVVQVLQAVHLLLAYPLFVVVVGVDPRWLLHSLEQHSGAFRISIELEEDNNTDDWHSTSLNYLEKIFQIPYTLRPMSSVGFTRLVDDLSAVKVSSQNPNGPPELSFGNGLTSQALSPIDQAAESYLSTVLNDQDLLIDTNPPSLELDERERQFMTRLHELIPTPRAAKRFVNVYRLIRTSITTEHELRWFLEAREYVAVQVLLATVTGAPAEASEILRKLLAQPEAGAWKLQWWDLVDEVIEPRLDRSSAWRRLNAHFGMLRADSEVPKTCESFRKWADDVARYSFYSGRVLLDLQVPDSEARS